MNHETWNKVKGTLQFAIENKYSAFYREKYAGLPIANYIRSESPDDFYKIPFLIKDELLRCPPLKRVFVDLSEVDIAYGTSGTGGKNPLICFHRLKMERSSLDFLSDYKNKLKFGLILESSPAAIRWYGKDYEDQGIPIFIGNPYKLQETAATAPYLKFDFIRTHAPILINFIPLLKEYYDLKNIKFISIGGEISDAQWKLFRGEFRNALISQTYSTAESFKAGIQCGDLARKERSSIYHISDRLFFEIIPEENGNIGEIAMTHIKSVPTVLIRYRTGDYGEILDDKCGCGIPTPLFKFHGRKEPDKIKMGGFEIHRESIANVLKESRGDFSEDFEAHFYQDIRPGGLIVNEIVVKVISKNGILRGSTVVPVLARAFNDKLRISNRFSIRELVDKGIFKPIKVELVDSFQKSEKIDSVQRLIPHF